MGEWVSIVVEVVETLVNVQSGHILKHVSRPCSKSDERVAKNEDWSGPPAAPPPPPPPAAAAAAAGAAEEGAAREMSVDSLSLVAVHSGMSDIQEFVLPDVEPAFCSLEVEHEK
ncbi:uncharacterized protein LOC124712382 [Schistocerca piceifrons]|uniref:uncharacterized protein LOC124712382 n=1 Tax=Schistocerca piceifrons TaxID=274613 RepID=UPI001F5EBC63|nr:uncharacterized protein LOC124712382 [Schistocerca piceifrons]